ncbi:MAG: SDR family NAD(P)-dependent oxidoreductase [Bdellovibrionota bacterium]
MPETKPSKKIALVTGASSGLGAEFALQIESAFYLDEIWMVARRAAPMKELAERFLKSRAVVLTLDLTSKSDLAALEKRLSEEKPEIEFLVNNAGYGKYGPFDRLGLDEQIKMIDLNITALTYLTRICLPYMKPGASILQVASSDAFSPMPFFSIYAATKSFVVSFADALGFELRDQGIRVLAVCPGPVETEFFTVAQKNEFMKDKVGQAEPANRALYASSQEVVAKALADLARGKRHSVFGFTIKLFGRLSPLVPLGLKLRIMARKNKLELLE